MSGGLREPLDVRRRAGALWLTLNRPAARNGLDAGLVAAIGAALDAAESDSGVAAVVITAGWPGVLRRGRSQAHRGAGGPAARSRPRRDSWSSSPRSGELFDRIEAFGKPVIAAVDGLAVAGGLELVLACDIVIATEAARFGDAHANYGLLPGGGGSARLPRRVGESTAKYLMFTGRDLPAGRPRPHRPCHRPGRARAPTCSPSSTPASATSPPRVREASR